MDASNDGHRSSAFHRHRCVHHHHHCVHHHHHNCIHKKHHLNCAHHHHHICDHSAGGLPHAPQPPRTAHPLLTPNTEASLHFSSSDPVDDLIVDCDGRKRVLTQQEVDNEEREGLDDDDPVFVMTDEWKEFFAKSEARRRLEKQQAKMKGKKKN